jgi:hypothetical protein
MAITASRKKPANQPDHVRVTHVSKSRKGVPIHSTVTTTVTGGLFKQQWSADGK